LNPNHNADHKPTVITDPRIGPRGLQVVTIQIRLPEFCRVSYLI